jgi:pimeloyl-ACP methyl ester carboxylesterase
VQLFWGKESWAPDPENDGRAAALARHEVVRVEGAGHWVHHDRLDLFLAESMRFLLAPD